MLEIIKKRESWALSLSFISRRGGITRAAGGRVENFAKTCSRAISPRYPAFPPPAKFTKARGPFRPPLRFRDIIFVAVRELASPLPPTILSDKVVEITGYDGQKTTRGDIPQRFCLFFSPSLSFSFHPSPRSSSREDFFKFLVSKIVLITRPTDHCITDSSKVRSRETNNR